MRKLIKESGVRDINNIAKRYKKAKIYFHQDLDGVTTAIAMKHYLEQNNINVVDAEVIQYGDKEFAVKKPDAKGDVMPVLVDFAHGKPMFIIHTDHHDTQAGAEETKATSFRHSRSNVETISQILSPKEIFPQKDIDLISTVDSANFATHNITVDQVMEYMFNLDKNVDVSRNKLMMGLVVNKLLLAFKNKKGFLEELVLDCKPSLINIFLKIKNIMQREGFEKIENLKKNQKDYIERMKSSEKVKVTGNIILQYGGGNMLKPGSYDRYTPFKNNPDADFLIIAWPLGLVQASCNPYKQNRELKGVDLGEIKNEVLDELNPELKSHMITLLTIKKISETKSVFGSVGFTFKDFMAIYGKSPSLKFLGNKKTLEPILESIMSRPFKTLSEKQKNILEKVILDSRDVINANSGGHKCITNISGINFVYRNKQNENKSYVDLTKEIQNKFYEVLNSKFKN